MKQDMKKTQDAVAKLTMLSNVYPNIRIVQRVLSVEAVILGKVPVVSSNTWMAYELSKYSLKDLIFISEDLRSLLNVIKSVVLKYEIFREKINLPTEKWREFRSRKNFVDIFLVSCQ